MGFDNNLYKRNFLQCLCVNKTSHYQKVFSFGIKEVKAGGNIRIFAVNLRGAIVTVVILIIIKAINIEQFWSLISHSYFWRIAW